MIHATNFLYFFFFFTSHPSFFLFDSPLNTCLQGVWSVMFGTLTSLTLTSTPGGCALPPSPNAWVVGQSLSQSSSFRTLSHPFSPPPGSHLTSAPLFLEAPLREGDRPHESFPHQVKDCPGNCRKLPMSKHSYYTMFAHTKL